MNGPQITENGEVVSASLSFEPVGNAAKHFFGNMTLMYGQVVNIYPRDSVQNSQGKPGWATYYDVLVYHPNSEQELLRRCLSLQPLFGGGPNNFMEVVQPNPGPNAQDLTISPSSKSGATVVVMCINGRRDQAIILGGVPHPAQIAVQDRPVTADGAVTRGEIQGLFFQVNNDGELEVTFNGPRDTAGKLVSDKGPTTLKLDKAGSITITTKNGQSFLIDNANKKLEMKSGPVVITLDTNAKTVQMQGATVKVGDGALQPMVLGNDVVSLIQDLCSALSSLTVVCGSPGSPSSPPTNAGDFGSIAGRAKNILSKHQVGK